MCFHIVTVVPCSKHLILLQSKGEIATKELKTKHWQCTDVLPSKHGPESWNLLGIKLKLPVLVAPHSAVQPPFDILTSPGHWATLGN